MTRVLVVEDDPPLARALSVVLRARGYEVSLASTGAAALGLAARALPDLVVLDLGLPDLDGLEVLAGLRGWTDVPVLVLSARQSQADKVQALDAGADDHLSKPFGMDELLARMRAALRRAAPSTTHAVVEADGFTVDRARKQVLADGAPVRLTPTEWNLLEVLVAHPDAVVGQAQLLQELWGDDDASRAHTLRVHLAGLRRKLGPEGRRHVETLPGLGYRFVPRPGETGGGRSETAPGW